MPIKQLLRWLKPTRIDRYILAEVTSPFIGGVAFFIFLFMMFRALNLAEFLIVHGVAGLTLLRLTGLMILTFMPAVLPVAFLIAILTGFGRLSADSEIVALKSSGLSLLRLSLPVTAFATLIVIFSLFLDLQWAPWGETKMKELLLKVGNTKVAASIKEGTFTRGFFDLLVFADKVDTKTNRLTRVFIYDEREKGNPMAVVAKSGEIHPVKTNSDLSTAILLKLYKGSIHNNNTEESTYQKMGFGEYKLYLKIDEAEGGTFMKPEMLTYSELQKKIQEHTIGTYLGAEFRGELWRRYAIAMAPWIFVFLGIGFGTLRTRAVRSSSALIAFLTLIVYWSLQTWTIMAITQRSWNPYFSPMIPNIAMLFVGFFAFRKAMW